MLRVGLIAAWCVSSDSAAGVAASPSPRTAEFLHIEANSGGSSGGHAALCIARECFHFQQTDDGLLRLVKDPADRFDHVYRALENRTIHAYRVPLADDALGRLAHAFASAHLVQDRQLAVRNALREEAAFLDALRAPSDAAGAGARRRASDRGRRRGGFYGARVPSPRMSRARMSLGRTPGGVGAVLVRVPGSGYFLPADAALGARASNEAAARSSPVIAELVRRLDETYGVDSLAWRERELRGEIARLAPPMNLAPLAPSAVDRLPPLWLSMAARYRELVSGWIATEVLRHGVRLRRDRVWGLPGPTVTAVASDRSALDVATLDVTTVDLTPLALAPRDIDALRVHQRASIDALVRLFGAHRPDWGYPMLVGIARLAALDTSIAARRLVLLDVFREDAPIVPPEIVARHREALTALADERRAEFGAARAGFFAGDGRDEMAWSRIETAGNLWLEMARALAGERPLRVHHDEPVPAASASGETWPRPRPADDMIAQARVEIEERERAYDRDLHALYPYDVMRSNCVTAIFHVVEGAIGRDGLPPPQGSHEPLDGRLALAGALDFIPFMSARSVARGLGVRATEHPSYRRIALARLGARDPRRPVWWREANVLSSQIYRRHGADAPFLFFTEDAAYFRPVFGAANLLVGVGATAVGIALVPFDGGAMARRGANAVLFSLPELVFMGIRKGTFPFTPRAWIDARPSVAPAAGRIPSGGAVDGTESWRKPAPPAYDVGGVPRETAHVANDQVAGCKAVASRGAPAPKRRRITARR